jgi:hypothetical protein
MGLVKGVFLTGRYNAAAGAAAPESPCSGRMVLPPAAPRLGCEDNGAGPSRSRRR